MLCWASPGHPGDTLPPLAPSGWASSVPVRGRLCLAWGPGALRYRFHPGRTSFTAFPSDGPSACSLPSPETGRTVWDEEEEPFQDWLGW